MARNAIVSEQLLLLLNFSFNSHWAYGESRVFKVQRDGQIVNKLTATADGKLRQMEL